MKVTIKGLNQQIIFKGDIFEMPIKKDYIIQKSIELFDDDDPCIIHKSYVIKQVVDDLITLLKIKDREEMALSPFKNELHFLNINDIENCTLMIEGK